MADATGPDKLAYYADVAASDPGRDYQRRVLAALELRPGHTVLDVGCGPGTDLADMAAAVTETGQVIGGDAEAAMVDEARRRTAGMPWVQVRVGDAHALPLADGSVDRARAVLRRRYKG
ncbi:MAG TPA: methyltransferase domain-containing protein [Pseudonocardiaceae bacterium]|jgi:ubiquinone/menaquinone biosynthesis C-methylase UbiE|nr:methyltransferase domain-containing protein [Pseudonocardiaceae bacterium]